MGLESEGLELRWEVEEVSLAALGRLRFVFGARRRRQPFNCYRSVVAGHVAVLKGEPRQASVWDCLTVAAEQGATLSVDALIEAKQTVILRRKGCGEIVAATYDASARHCLRLEAELATATSMGEGLTGVELWEARPRFDAEHGWMIS